MFHATAFSRPFKHREGEVNNEIRKKKKKEEKLRKNEIIEKKETEKERERKRKLNLHEQLYLNNRVEHVKI